jgi:hypothetical protein
MSDAQLFYASVVSCHLVDGSMNALIRVLGTRQVAEEVAEPWT